MLGPVHHIRRRGEHPVLQVEVTLLAPVFVVVGKQVERAVMDHGGRIGGIHRLNNRVDREGRRGQRSQHGQENDCGAGCFLHGKMGQVEYCGI